MKAFETGAVTITLQIFLGMGLWMAGTALIEWNFLTEFSALTVGWVVFTLATGNILNTWKNE